KPWSWTYLRCARSWTQTLRHSLLAETPAERRPAALFQCRRFGRASGGPDCVWAVLWKSCRRTWLVLSLINTELSTEHNAGAVSCRGYHYRWPDCSRYTSSPLNWLE